MDKLVRRRFAAKVKVAANGCWLWTGATVNKRYGKMKIDGVTYLAHRLAWEHKYGPIPDNLTVDHKVEEGICSSTLCVRPSHLQLLTRSANNWKQNGSSEFYYACGHSRAENSDPNYRGCYTCALARQRYQYRLYGGKRRFD